MTDEYELDFNEESDKEKKVLFSKKSLDLDQNIRDLSKSKSKRTADPKVQMANTPDFYQTAPSRSKYFFFFYNNSNNDQVKDYLYDRSFKVTNNNNWLSSVETCKNVYLMFVNSEKKYVKAIMKKDYIKYEDKDNKMNGVFKMETKTKQEISFRELVIEYKFSDENLSRMNLENSEIENCLTNDLDIGNGLIVMEIKDEEGIYVFEKIRNAMTRKEEYEKKKLKSRRRVRSESSSESSSSSSSSEKVEKKKNYKNANENYLKNPQSSANNPYMMNYFFPYPSPQFYPGMQNPKSAMPTEQIPFFPYPQFQMNPNMKSEVNQPIDMNNVTFCHPPQFNPNLLAVFHQMQYQQNAAMSQYAMNVPNANSKEDLQKPSRKEDKKKKNFRTPSRSHSKSSLSKSPSEASDKNKKYFDLKHINQYNELEKKNAKNKEEELNLNDINVIELDSKKERKLSYSSSSESIKCGSIEKNTKIPEMDIPSSKESRSGRSKHSNRSASKKISESDHSSSKDHKFTKNKRQRSRSDSKSKDRYYFKSNDSARDNYEPRINNRKYTQSISRKYNTTNNFSTRNFTYRRDNYNKIEPYRKDSHEIIRDEDQTRYRMRNRKYSTERSSERNYKFEENPNQSYNSGEVIKTYRNNYSNENDSQKYEEYRRHGHEKINYGANGNLRSYNSSQKFRRNYEDFSEDILKKNKSYITNQTNKDNLSHHSKSKSRSQSKKKSEVAQELSIKKETESENVREIKEEKIATDKIVTDKIVTNKIVTDKIVTNKIVADKIVADKIPAEKTVSNSQTDNIAAPNKNSTTTTTKIKRIHHSNFSAIPPELPKIINQTEEQVNILKEIFIKRKTLFNLRPPIKELLMKAEEEEEVNTSNVSNVSNSANNISSLTVSSESKSNVTSFNTQVNTSSFGNHSASGNLKIINELGKKKIILNKDRKNPELKVVKRDK